jgi:hypothetical protein
MSTVKIYNGEIHGFEINKFMEMTIATSLD